MEGMRGSGTGSVTMRNKKKSVPTAAKQDNNKQVVVQRRSLQLTARRQADKGPNAGTDLNRTMTLSASPDIVTSCGTNTTANPAADPLTSEVIVLSSENSMDSKRSSASLDDSFGILTPGQMKDFSVNSMTQSVTSNCSMVKDISWDDLNTNTITCNNNFTGREDSDCKQNNAGRSICNSTFTSEDPMVENEPGKENSLSPTSQLNSTFSIATTATSSPKSPNSPSQQSFSDKSPNQLLDKTFKVCGDKVKQSLNQTFDSCTIPTSTTILKRINSLNTTTDLERPENIELEIFAGDSTANQLIGRGGCAQRNAQSRRNFLAPNFDSKDNGLGAGGRIQCGGRDRASSWRRYHRKGERFSLDTDKLNELEALAADEKCNTEDEGGRASLDKKLNSTFHISMLHSADRSSASQGPTSVARSSPPQGPTTTSTTNTRLIPPSSPPSITRFSTPILRNDMKTGGRKKGLLTSTYSKKMPAPTNTEIPQMRSQSPDSTWRHRSVDEAMLMSPCQQTTRKSAKDSNEKIRQLFPNVSPILSTNVGTDVGGGHSLVDLAAKDGKDSGADIGQELMLRTEQLLRSNSGKKAKKLNTVLDSLEKSPPSMVDMTHNDRSINQSINSTNLVSDTVLLDINYPGNHKENEEQADCKRTLARETVCGARKSDVAEGQNYSFQIIQGDIDMSKIAEPSNKPSCNTEEAGASTSVCNKTNVLEPHCNEVSSIINSDCIGLSEKYSKDGTPCNTKSSVDNDLSNEKHVLQSPCNDDLSKTHLVKSTSNIRDKNTNDDFSGETNTDKSLCNITVVASDNFLDKTRIIEPPCNIKEKSASDNFTNKTRTIEPPCSIGEKLASDKIAGQTNVEKSPCCIGGDGKDASRVSVSGCLLDGTDVVNTTAVKSTALLQQSEDTWVPSPFSATPKTFMGNSPHKSSHAPPPPNPTSESHDAKEGPCKTSPLEDDKNIIRKSIKVKKTTKKKSCKKENLSSMTTIAAPPNPTASDNDIPLSPPHISPTSDNDSPPPSLPTSSSPPPPSKDPTLSNTVSGPTCTTSEVQKEGEENGGTGRRGRTPEQQKRGIEDGNGEEKIREAECEEIHQNKKTEAECTQNIIPTSVEQQQHVIITADHIKYASDNSTDNNVDNLNQNDVDNKVIDPRKSDDANLKIDERCEVELNDITDDAIHEQKSNLQKPTSKNYAFDESSASQPLKNLNQDEKCDVNPTTTQCKSDEIHEAKESDIDTKDSDAITKDEVSTKDVISDDNELSSDKGKDEEQCENYLDTKLNAYIPGDSVIKARRASYSPTTTKRRTTSPLLDLPSTSVEHGTSRTCSPTTSGVLGSPSIRSSCPTTASSARGTTTTPTTSGSSPTTRSAPNTPESKRRSKPVNKLLEKVQMQGGGTNTANTTANTATNTAANIANTATEPLLESTHSQSSQGRGSLFDSQYSTTDPQSLAVSVTLSTDMESSGFFSDLDGRISKNETQTLDDADSLQQDSTTNLHISGGGGSHQHHVSDSTLPPNIEIYRKRKEDSISLKLSSEGNDDTTAATITLEDVSGDEEMMTRSPLCTTTTLSSNDDKSINQLNDDESVNDNDLIDHLAAGDESDYKKLPSRGVSDLAEKLARTKEEMLSTPRTTSTSSATSTRKSASSPSRKSASSPSGKSANSPASGSAVSPRFGAKSDSRTGFTVQHSDSAVSSPSNRKTSSSKPGSPKQLIISESEKARQARAKKPGKWDAIMNRIHGGKKPDIKKTERAKKLSRDLSNASSRSGIGLPGQEDRISLASNTSNLTSSNTSHFDELSPRSDRSSLILSPKHRPNSSKIGDKENRSEGKSRSLSLRKESTSSRVSLWSRSSIRVSSANKGVKSETAVLAAKNQNNTSPAIFNSDSNKKALSTKSSKSAVKSSPRALLSNNNNRLVINSNNNKNVVKSSEQQQRKNSDNSLVKTGSDSGRTGSTNNRFDPAKTGSPLGGRLSDMGGKNGGVASNKRRSGVDSGQARTSMSKPAAGLSTSRTSTSYSPGIQSAAAKKTSVTRVSKTSTNVSSTTKSTTPSTQQKSATSNSTNARNINNNNNKSIDGQRKNAKVSRASLNNNNNSHSSGQRSSRSSAETVAAVKGQRGAVDGGSGGISSGQPDLLKETIRKDCKLREDQNQDFEVAKQSIRWNSNGFTMLAIVANYYIERHAEAEKKIQQLLEKSSNTKDDSQLNAESQQNENSKTDHDLQKALEERDAIEKEHAEAIKQLEHTIQQLEQQKTQLESDSADKITELEARHAKESAQHQKDAQALLIQKVQQSSETLEAGFKERLTNERTEFEARLANQKTELEKTLTERSLAEKNELESRLKSEYARQSAELQDRLKSEFEASRAEETAKLREAWEEDRKEEERRKEEEKRKAEEEKSNHHHAGSGGAPEKKGTANKKVDYRLEAEKERAGRLEQEVESLRTVLEMKTEELHVSRHTRLKLEETIEDYKQKEEAWRKACAQVEDLKVQLIARNEAERRLMEENQRLNSIMEKELNERKRLSMENEQLTWKIKQECEGLMSQSLCEGFDYSFTRGGVGRPGSAPPCKNPLASVSLPFMGDPANAEVPPDSPRVMEVVEKLESVSWKLEYDLPENSPSPGMRRKMSPHSPMFLRKCKSSLMTRSLDRSALLTRSNSSPNHNNSPVTSHQLLSRSTSIRRKKSPPQFETLSEYTDESDESKKSASPNGSTPPPSSDKKCANATQRENAPSNGMVGKNAPNPVEIIDCGGSDLVDDDFCCEISSSSEIEIGGSIPDPDSIAALCEEDIEADLGKARQIFGEDDITDDLGKARQIYSSNGAATGEGGTGVGRKLDFKGLEPGPTVDLLNSPAYSDDLHSPVTEPTLRQGGACDPVSRKSRDSVRVVPVQSSTTAVANTTTAVTNNDHNNLNCTTKTMPDFSGARDLDDLDSDISESGDELPDSDQAS